ncbi:MAG: gliding motility-associated C-terminal domain-containing protein [Prevotellaceae bacterium]|jgi:gliding motility-associated-like protein|nr:gliding motility-associated C-terminal domain-containing protein [Prevotellaceae bacterium]
MKTQSCSIKAILIVLFSFACFNTAHAQCTFDLDATVIQHSICTSNGIIEVTLSGSEIDVSNVLITLTGGTINELSSTNGHRFISLPAGEYTVTATTVCKGTNKEVSKTAKLTVDMEYDALNAAIQPDKRPSLFCLNTGMISIEIWDGRAPYKVKMTKKPDEYIGPDEFFIGYAGTMNISDLTPGEYSFTVFDDCSFSVPLSISVSRTPTDFPTDIFEEYAEAKYNNCMQARVYANFMPDNSELAYYWNYYKSIYYELAFSVDDEKNWITPSSDYGGYWQDFDLPDSYRKMYSEGKTTIDVYIRLKDTDCEMLIDKIKLSEPPQNTIWSSFTKDCKGYKWKFGLNNDQAMCAPYKWELYDESNKLVKVVENLDYVWDESVEGLEFGKKYTLIIMDAEEYKVIETASEQATVPQLVSHWPSWGCDTYRYYYYVYDICVPYKWEVYDDEENLVNSKDDISDFEGWVTGLEYEKDYVIKIIDQLGQFVQIDTRQDDPPRGLEYYVIEYRCDNFDIFLTPYLACTAHDWKLFDSDNDDITVSDPDIKWTTRDDGVELTGLKYGKTYTVSAFDGVTTVSVVIGAHTEYLPYVYTYTYGDLQCYDYEYEFLTIDVNCYPYKWEIVDDGGVIVAEKSGITKEEHQECSGYYKTRLEYNKEYTVKVTDSKGYEISTTYKLDNETYIRYFNIYSEISPCVSNEYQSRLYLYDSWYGRLDTDTRIHFVEGPQEPIHTDVTLDKEIYTFSPFIEDYENDRYTTIAEGDYTFEITDKCGNVSTHKATLKRTAEVKNISYTLDEETDICEGVTRVYPKGNVHVDGNRAEYTWFRMAETPDDNGLWEEISVDRDPGSYFTISKTGRYVIEIYEGSYWGPYNCAYSTIVIDHTRKSFSLDGRSSYICEMGGEGNIRVQAKNGRAPYTYELLTTDEQPVPDVPSNNTGVFSYGALGECYKVRITDGCGKSFIIDVQITTLDQMTLVGGAKELCAGDEINLTCLVIGATSYQWITPTGEYNMQNLVIPGASDANNGEYVIKVKPAGCDEFIEDKATINVYTTPFPSIGNEVDYCESESASQLYVEPLPDHIINWYDINDNLLPEAPIPNTNNTGSTKYYVEQVQTLLGCASEKIEVLVNVSGMPLKNANATGWSCEGGLPNLTITDAIAGYVYTIYPDDTETDAIITFDGTGETMNISMPKAISEETVFYLHTATKAGCALTQAITKFTVTVDGISIEPDALPIYIHNEPYSVQLTTNAAPVFAISEGKLVTGLTMSSDGLISGVVPESAGYVSEIFKVKVMNNNGCSKEKAYFLRSCEPAPDVSFDEIMYCEGAEAVPLEASSSGGLPLQWYDENLSKLNEAPTPNTGKTGKQLYYVALVNEELGCEGAKAEITVTVHPLPQLTFTATADDICYQSAPSIFMEDLDDTFSYDIYANKSLSEKLANVTGKALASVNLEDILEDKTFYYITVTDDKGCVSLNSLEVEVGVIKLEINPSKLPAYRKTVDYDQQLESNAESPVFSVIDGNLPVGLLLSSSGRIYGKVPAEERNLNTIFTVQVEDANGCNTIREYVLSSELFVPKVFTPNGDGINDMFMPSYKLIIFDRLGITIFEGDDGWDGSYKNKPAPPDIYFYKLFYENEAGETKVKTGYIGLER